MRVFPDPSPRRRALGIIINWRVTLLLLLLMMMTTHPPEEVERQQSKPGEDRHLQNNARDDDIVPYPQSLRVRLRGGVDAAADALQDEAEDVEGDEDPGVQAGLQAGQPGADGQGDVLEGEVDAGADEGGRQDEADDLDLEAVQGPRVAVQQEAADVAFIFSSLIVRGLCSIK